MPSSTPPPRPGPAAEAKVTQDRAIPCRRHVSVATPSPLIRLTGEPAFGRRVTDRHPRMPDGSKAGERRRVADFNSSRRRCRRRVRELRLHRYPLALSATGGDGRVGRPLHRTTRPVIPLDRTPRATVMRSRRFQSISRSHTKSVPRLQKSHDLAMSEGRANLHEVVVAPDRQKEEQTHQDECREFADRLS